MEEPISDKTIDINKFVDGVIESGVMDTLSKVAENCIVADNNKKIYSEKEIHPVLDKYEKEINSVLNKYENCVNNYENRVNKYEQLANDYIKTQKVLLAMFKYLEKYQEVTNKIIDMNEENTKEFRRLSDEAGLKELSDNLQSDIKKLY